MVKKLRIIANKYNRISLGLLISGVLFTLAGGIILTWALATKADADYIALGIPLLSIGFILLITFFIYSYVFEQKMTLKEAILYL